MLQHVHYERERIAASSALYQMKEGASRAHEAVRALEEVVGRLEVGGAAREALQRSLAQVREATNGWSEAPETFHGRSDWRVIFEPQTKQPPAAPSDWPHSAGGVDEGEVEQMREVGEDGEETPADSPNSDGEVVPEEVQQMREVGEEADEADEEVWHDAEASEEGEQSSQGSSHSEWGGEQQQEGGGRTWRETSGRETGGEGYQFGDLTRAAFKLVRRNR